MGALSSVPASLAGESRTYSAVSAYSIDKASMTAQDVWDYDAGKTIYSALCSSSYEAAEKSLLLDYSFADSGKQAILVGLNAARETVFSFEYASSMCTTGWNARPVALDDLQIDQ